MKPLAMGLMTVSLLSAIAPAHAATVLQTSGDSAQIEILAKDYAPGVLDAFQTSSGTTDNAVDVIGNTIANYAAMLPEPSEWVLLVAGFGAIGYAMRSRKRAYISFN